jgi:hypothetical protein
MSTYIIAPKSNDIVHFGKGHDDNPPGRGSGRYAWGTGNGDGAKEKKAKIKETAKKAAATTGKVLLKGASIVASVAAKTVLTTAITSAAVGGLALVGSAVINSPEFDQAMQKLSLKVFEWHTRRTAQAQVDTLKTQAEVYGIIGEAYLDALTGK